MNNTQSQYQLIMLPTDKATGLFIEIQDLRGNPIYPNNRKIEFTTNETLIRNNHLISSGKAATNVQNKYNFYELYIIDTKAEIKEGDYYIANNELFAADEVFNEGNNPNIHKYPKVICSSDKSLFPSSWIDIYKSQWIIDYYNKNGKMPEIELEMRENEVDSILSNKTEAIYKIKTNPNGSIIIISKNGEIYYDALSTGEPFQIRPISNNMKQQTEESWDDIMKRYMLIPLHERIAFAVWVSVNYHPPINKNIVQEKMYNKLDVMGILENYRSFANSSKGDTTLWYLQTYIKDNLK